MPDAVRPVSPVHRRWSRVALLLSACGLGTATVAGCGGPAAPVPLTSAILDVKKPASPDVPPEPMREFRAAWVATVGNIDWPTKPGLSTAEQQREAIAILDRSAELHLNAIVFQVRPVADALYDSKLEPWSAFLTGTQGKAPDPYYDPLRFWVDEAHKRGIELHAWFNPYRTRYDGRHGEVADTHVSKTRPDLVRDYGKVSVLDPGEPESADRTFNVFMDVVDRYDVDGIHIDDYFYPYPEAAPGKGAGVRPFPDDATFAKYQKAGGTLALADWRRKNVSDLVHRVYDGIKQRKPAVKFGISPFGIPRPGLDTIPYVTGFDQHEKLYADTVLWLQSGWCDYFVPQLYWKTSMASQPFPGLLNYWVSHNPKGRHVYAGQYTSRINGSETSWLPDEILGQIMITRVTPGAHGEVHFSMAALTQNRKKISDLLRDGPYAEPALPPVPGWLDHTPPPAPTGVTASAIGGAATVAAEAAADTLTVTPSGSPADTRPSTRPVATGQHGVRIAWHPSAGEPAWVWAVQYKVGNAWKLKVVPGDQTAVTVDAGKGPATKVTHVNVAAVDRCGNMSPRATEAGGEMAATAK